MYSTAVAFLEALQEIGVSYIFANLGSDHPAIIEAFASAKQKNKGIPTIITCPHEFVALSAAHGYAQTTGEAQAVFVHVDCGTQNLGGAIHNAAKSRVPVLVFAGASPYTQENEMTGSRNEYIHWYQDVFAQRNIISGYTKYDNEIRSGSNVKQLTYRAFQIAQSEPKGPVYLMGPRETMEEEAKPVGLDKELWKPISPCAVAPQQVEELTKDLLSAENPLIITSYLGRNTDAVGELVYLVESLAVPVLESVPYYLNFPAYHSMYYGSQWNTTKQNEALEQADFVLVIDSDVPWIRTNNKPSEKATIYYIDIDPLKEQMPLWYIPSKHFIRADSHIALKQINQKLKTTTINHEKVSSRWDRISRNHDRLITNKRRIEETVTDTISPQYIMACLRDLIDENTIVLNEGVTNYGVISNHIELNKPGSYFASGASSLGWNGGAAIGMKLAHPNKTIINLTGDGSYFFSIPSVVHWMAKRYATPFLTIIFNNHGWKAPKLSTLGVHSKGIAKQTESFWTDLDPPANLAKIAEAAGETHAITVKKRTDLTDALNEGINRVKKGQSAVLDVTIPHVYSN